MEFKFTNPLAGILDQLSELNEARDRLSKAPIPTFEGNNLFTSIDNNLVNLNAMILAIVDLLTPEQQAAFPEAYARKLSELKLSIASSNPEGEKNP